VYAECASVAASIQFVFAQRGEALAKSHFQRDPQSNDIPQPACVNSKPSPLTKHLDIRQVRKKKFASYSELVANTQMVTSINR